MKKLAQAKRRKLWLRRRDQLKSLIKKMDRGVINFLEDVGCVRNEAEKNFPGPAAHGCEWGDEDRLETFVFHLRELTREVERFLGREIIPEK